MCSSTPSSWQKFAEFKRNLRKRERKKIHTEQPRQILRFIADFPVLQSCQTTAVPEGDYLQTPHGLGHHVSSDDVTRDLCAAACCLRNSWRQKSIPPDPEFMAGSGLWHCLVQPADSFQTKKQGHPVGNAAFPEFRSLCKKLLLRGSHTEPPAWDRTVFPLPHQSEIVCLLLWGKGS